jgi:hypothetical protein
MKKLLLKDVNQDIIDELVLMAEQRAVYAACISGLMELNLVDHESIILKNTIVEAIGESISKDIIVRDYVESSVNKAIKAYLDEQREINSLLKDVL